MSFGITIVTSKYNDCISQRNCRMVTGPWIFQRNVMVHKLLISLTNPMPLSNGYCQSSLSSQAFVLKSNNSTLLSFVLPDFFLNNRLLSEHRHKIEAGSKWHTAYLKISLRKQKVCCYKLRAILDSDFSSYQNSRFQVRHLTIFDSGSYGR